MSPLEEALLSHRPEVSVETLKAAAASAARGFLHKQASMNESIAGSAKELRLNDNQIDRVAQAANTLVFKAKYASSEDNKVVEFPVANPAVIKSLVDATPTMSMPTTVVLKLAQYIPGADLVARHTPEKVKVANYAPEHFTTDLTRVFADLVALEPQMASEVAGAQSRVKTAGANLVTQARSLVEHEGADFYDLVDAISQVAKIPSLVKVAADLMADSLLKDRMLKVSPGHEKRAGRQVDQANPLCVSYRQLEDAYVDVQAKKSVLKDIQEQAAIAKTAMISSAYLEHGMLKTAGPATGSTWQRFLKGVGLGADLPASVTNKVENYTQKHIMDKAKELFMERNPGFATAVPQRELAKELKSAESLLGPRFRDEVVSKNTFELTPAGKALRFAGIAAAGGLTAHAAAGAYERSKEKALFNSSLNAAMRDGKDLQNMDPATIKKNFGVLWRFAPDMAQQPTVASSFLRQASFRSDLGVDPNTVKMLADIQKAHAEAGGAQGKGNLAGSIRGIAGMAGIGG